MIRTLDKNLETLIHTGPVLQVFTLQRNINIIASLTKTQLYVWTKENTDHPLESDYICTTYTLADQRLAFVDMVRIDDKMVAGDTAGNIRVFDFDATSRVISEVSTIVSIQGSKIIDISYSNDNLFVLHKGGLLNRFHGMCRESYDLFKNGGSRKPVPCKVYRWCTKIEAHHYEPADPGLPDLLFVKEREHIAVYGYAPTVNSPAQPITRIAYVSEEVRRPDAGAIYSTSIRAFGNVVLLGNRDGYTTSWSIKMQKLYKHGLQMQFTPIASCWHHGKGITCMELNHHSLHQFSFDKDGYCCVVDLKHNLVKNKFIPHCKAVRSAYISYPHGMLLTASDDCTVKLWRVWVPDVVEQRPNECSKEAAAACVEHATEVATVEVM